MDFDSYAHAVSVIVVQQKHLDCLDLVVLKVKVEGAESAGCDPLLAGRSLDRASSVSIGGQPLDQDFKGGFEFIGRGIGDLVSQSALVDRLNLSRGCPGVTTSYVDMIAEVSGSGNSRRDRNCYRNLKAAVQFRVADDQSGAVAGQLMADDRAEIVPVDATPDGRRHGVSCLLGVGETQVCCYLFLGLPNVSKVRLASHAFAVGHVGSIRGITSSGQSVTGSEGLVWN